MALYHASPRDPVWEYVLWPDQAAECIAAQAARVSLVGHSHVALFFVTAENGAEPGARPGDRAPRRRQGRPGRRRHPAQPLRGPLADQSRQRRPAPRRRSARGLAGARHGHLGGHLPPNRVRDRPRRRGDRGHRAAGAPGQATVRGAVNGRWGQRLTRLAAMPGTKQARRPACSPRRRSRPLSGCGSDEISGEIPQDERRRSNAALRAVRGAVERRDCDAAQTAADQFVAQVNALPADAGDELKAELRAAGENLQLAGGQRVRLRPSRPDDTEHHVDPDLPTTTSTTRPPTTTTTPSTTRHDDHHPPTDDPAAGATARPARRWRRQGRRDRRRRRRRAPAATERRRTSR